MDTEPQIQGYKSKTSKVLIKVLIQFVSYMANGVDHPHALRGHSKFSWVHKVVLQVDVTPRCTCDG